MKKYLLLFSFLIIFCACKTQKYNVDNMEVVSEYVNKEANYRLIEYRDNNFHNYQKIIKDNKVTIIKLY